MQYGGHAGETKVADKNGSIETGMTCFFLQGSTAFLVEKGVGLEDWTRVRRRGRGGEAGGHTDSEESLVDGLVLKVVARKVLPTYRTGGAMIQ